MTRSLRAEKDQTERTANNPHHLSPPVHSGSQAYLKAHSLPRLNPLSRRHETGAPISGKLALMAPSRSPTMVSTPRCADCVPRSRDAARGRQHVLRPQVHGADGVDAANGAALGLPPPRSARAHPPPPPRACRFASRQAHRTPGHGKAATPPSAQTGWRWNATASPGSEPQLIGNQVAGAREVERPMRGPPNPPSTTVEQAPGSTLGAPERSQRARLAPLGVEPAHRHPGKRHQLRRRIAASGRRCRRQNPHLRSGAGA